MVLLVFGTEAMIQRDSQGHSYWLTGGEILGPVQDGPEKALTKIVLINQE